MRHYLYEGFTWFVAAYRTGRRETPERRSRPALPRGSFPPALPFVSWQDGSSFLGLGLWVHGEGVPGWLIRRGFHGLADAN